MSLLDRMKAHNVKRIVFLSSVTVYGDPDIVPITEESKTGGTTNPCGKLEMLSVFGNVYI